MYHDKFDYESIPAGHYDRVLLRRSGIQSFWHHQKFAEVARELHEQRLNRVLDYGCGPGSFLGNYAAHSNSVGLDLASNQIEYARVQYNSTGNLFFTTTEYALDSSSSSSFEAVVSIELIEHVSVRELDEILASLSSVLSGGAQLVLTTPNYSGPWPALEWLMAKMPSGMSYDQQHISRWTAKSLEIYLRDRGFGTVHIRSFVAIAPFVAPISWKLAERVADCERRFARRFGFLLIARAKR